MLASALHRNRIGAVEIKPSPIKKIGMDAGSLGQDMAEQDSGFLPVPPAYPPPGHRIGAGRKLNLEGGPQITGPQEVFLRPSARRCHGADDTNRTSVKTVRDLSPQSSTQTLAKASVG